MTSGGFKVDTGAVTLTSKQVEQSVATIISYFRTMDTESQDVLSMCSGDMVAEATRALGELQTLRNRLIPKLQNITSQMNSGGQGMSSQDQGAGQKMRGLNASINQPR